VGPRVTILADSEINLIEKFRVLSHWLNLQISCTSNATSSVFGTVTAMS